MPGLRKTLKFRQGDGRQDQSGEFCQTVVDGIRKDPQSEKALTEIVPDFKLRVQSFKNKCSSALASMSSALETSNFNQADDYLGSQDEERQMLKNHIVQNIMSVIEQQQSLRQLLMKVQNILSPRRSYRKSMSFMTA